MPTVIYDPEATPQKVEYNLVLFSRNGIERLKYLEFLTNTYEIYFHGDTQFAISDIDETNAIERNYSFSRYPCLVFNFTVVNGKFIQRPYRLFGTAYTYNPLLVNIPGYIFDVNKLRDTLVMIMPKKHNDTPEDDIITNADLYIAKRGRAYGV